jgi:hypothetical protein
MEEGNSIRVTRYEFLQFMDSNSYNFLFHLILSDFFLVQSLLVSVVVSCPHSIHDLFEVWERDGFFLAAQLCKDLLRVEVVVGFDVNEGNYSEEL